MNMNGRLVFLICLPRSGSTMLSRMLAMHSKIYCRPEPHIFGPLRQLGFYGSVSHPGFVTFRHPEFVKKLPTFPVGIVQASIRNIVNELPRKEEDYRDALRAYVDTLYGKLLDAAGKELFVDKTLEVMLFWDFVRKLYPDCRRIALTRHPLAAALSLKRLQERMPGFLRQAVPDLSEAAMTMALADIPNGLPAFVAGLARAIESGPETVHHIVYEKLAQDPETEMKRLCEFLGYEFEPDMIEYGKEKPWVGPGDPLTTHTRRRPDPSFVDSWRDKLRGDAEALEFARKIVDGLSEHDVEVMGYSLAEMRSLVEA